MANANNIQIRPMNVTFGEDRAQVFTISMIGDTSSNLNDTYFWIYDEDATEAFYVWFNVATAGSDPSPTGSIATVSGIEVAIAENASAATVAAAVQAAINADADFSATVSTSLVTVTNAAAGDSRAPHNGNIPTGLGFELEVTTPGSSASDVGFIDGEISLSQEEETSDITAHQYGTSVIGGFTTGRTVSLSITLKETSKAQLLKMLKAGSGSSVSGSGATGTEVGGFGTDSLFANQFTKAQKLTMHPIAKPLGDLSEDFTFWKAYPQIGEFTFSGEAPFTIPITFKIFPDFTKVGQVRYYSIGDGTQTFTV